MEHSVALRLLIVMLEHVLLRAWLSSSRAIVSLLGGAVELPGKQGKPKHQDWRGLVGGCLASLVIYLTIATIYVLGARLYEFGIAVAWATVLQLLAASVIAVTSSRWRRFAAGVAVVSGLGFLILAFIFVLVLLARLMFRPW
jgi:hypothetical protein